MKRRDLLKLAAVGAASLAAPRIGRAAGADTLTFIPQADLATLDPVWTTANVTRNHAYLVFDTLYGLDESYRPQPQMLAGHAVEDDGRLWNLTLRESLKWHDGEKVLARDCVASIRRWAARDAFGRALLERTDELSAPSDSVIRFRLKKPFPLLPDALAKTASNMPCMMPERLAQTDPGKQVTEMTGSGPYRFIAAERVAGSQAVYEKFAGYVPRPEGTPSFTAGPKIALIGRVKWTTIPDSSTAAAALQSGEADWWEEPTIDLVPALKRNRDLKVEINDPAGGIGIMRFNCLFPPFDKAAIRRAILPAISQDEFMTAVAGPERTYWRDKVGVFSAGTPMATEAGTEVMAGNIEKAKRELQAAGYNGERVVMLAPADLPRIYALGQVGADTLKKIGMNVDFQSLDWGTVVQRRASRQPPDKGGWNIFFTYLEGTNNFNPAGQLGIRGSGAKAWFGWPDDPKLEALREAWFAAPDLAAQQRICAEIQREAFDFVPYVPLGEYFQPIAVRADLAGIRKGFPQFYNVKRT